MILGTWFKVGSLRFAVYVLGSKTLLLGPHIYRVFGPLGPKVTNMGTQTHSRPEVLSEFGKKAESQYWFQMGERVPVSAVSGSWS